MRTEIEIPTKIAVVGRFGEFCVISHIEAILDFFREFSELSRHLSILIPLDGIEFKYRHEGISTMKEYSDKWKDDVHRIEVCSGFISI